MWFHSIKYGFWSFPHHLRFLKTILFSNDPPPPCSFFRRLPFFFRNLYLSCDRNKSWNFYKEIQKSSGRNPGKTGRHKMLHVVWLVVPWINVPTKNAQLFCQFFAYALRKTPALIFKVFQTYFQCNFFPLIFQLQFSLFPSLDFSLIILSP